VRRLAAALALALLLAGCDGNDADTGTTETAQPPAASTTNDVRVYFLRDGRVWPALRTVPRDRGQANAALDELLRGPTARESSELGFTTALPADIGTFFLFGPPGGRRGAVSLDFQPDLPSAAHAQVVYTLTQFPLVEAVILDDRTYRRADFEDQTPAILVESPLAFAEVASPLHSFGTANTFEATFSYELKDADGDILVEDFVTATSGTGTRGSFEISAPFDLEDGGPGSLDVFERSAKDGSRINVVEIPLRLRP
jgi:germination protein M